jgi:hypothetical protein
MRGRSGQVSCGLAASLTALALLPACAADAGTLGKTSTSRTSQTTSATTVTTTANAAPPATQGPRTEKWIDLQVGDCLADLPPTDLSVLTVTIVDCAAGHEAEVYFRAAMEVNAAVADVAHQDCDVGFSRYTGRSIDGSPFAVTYLIDSNQDRTSSDPYPSAVICVLYDANGAPLTQSARR